MTQAHERTATLSELVAEEIRALMARRKVSGRELATQLSVSPSWVSYRLSGKQPIDINDLAAIARVLGVGVHELLPAPEIAARAAAVQTTREYVRVAASSLLDQRLSTGRPPDSRPPLQHAATGPGRTSYVPRPRRAGRDR